jgi:hypothetical protein
VAMKIKKTIRINNKLFNELKEVVIKEFDGEYSFFLDTV